MMTRNQSGCSYNGEQYGTTYNAEAAWQNKEKIHKSYSRQDYKMKKHASLDCSCSGNNIWPTWVPRGYRKTTENRQRTVNCSAVYTTSIQLLKKLFKHLNIQSINLILKILNM